ncbi:MAG: LacI family DNA-binding transcriptional regulator [Acetobacteraceae bacterium]|nr:LacI family DNA-binding transcriptional regulator [Acetobacteraceae bacterium]
MPGSARTPRAPVKITDVAAAAGVAPMTVSRVINTPDRVSAETAARVRAAIERLGYVPNLIAGGLSSRRSRMVAAIVPTIAHPMFAGLVQTFTDAMRRAGYQVMLSLSGYSDDDAAADALLRALLGRRPDALLITGASHSAAARQMLVEAHVPIVEIWDVSPMPIDMLVGFNHAQVGAEVAAFFQAKGHDRFITISADDARALERIEGFIQAVQHAGGTMLGNTVLPAPSTIMEGRRALRDFLPQLTQRTALFCSSDLLAFGAITEAKLHGIAVPEQLAVCGFGNFELSSATEPPFTTVNVEGAEAGSLAANFLLRRLAGEPAREEDRVHVSFRIVERGST